MSQDIKVTETLTIETVRRNFEAWRKTSKLHEPIPIELWKAAASLCKTQRPYIIARKLHLNYSKLKEHVDNSQVDLPAKKAPTKTDGPVKSQSSTRN